MSPDFATPASPVSRHGIDVPLRRYLKTSASISIIARTTDGSCPFASADDASFAAMIEFIFLSTSAEPVSLCENTTAPPKSDPGAIEIVSHSNIGQIDALPALSISPWYRRSSSYRSMISTILLAAHTSPPPESIRNTTSVTPACTAQSSATATPIG